MARPLTSTTKNHECPALQGHSVTVTARVRGFGLLGCVLRRFQPKALYTQSKKLLRALARDRKPPPSRHGSRGLLFLCAIPTGPDLVDSLNFLQALSSTFSPKANLRSEGICFGAGFPQKDQIRSWSSPESCLAYVSAKRVVDSDAFLTSACR